MLLCLNLRNSSSLEYRYLVGCQSLLGTLRPELFRQIGCSSLLELKVSKRNRVTTHPELAAAIARSVRMTVVVLSLSVSVF